MSHLATKLAQERTKRKYTVTFVAMHVGISHSTLRDLEQGRVTNPHVNTLLALAKFYRLTVDELLVPPTTIRHFINIIGEWVFKTIGYCVAHAWLWFCSVAAIWIGLAWLKQFLLWLANLVNPIT